MAVFEASGGPAALAFEEIDRLTADTFQAMGLSESQLGETQIGSVLLKGIDAFVKGVRAHCAKALIPGSDLRALIETKPAFLSMAVYMGVTGAVNEIAERYENTASPLEFRGFMASFSLLAWETLVSTGVDFDPGKNNMPSAIFDRLEIGSDEDHPAEPASSGSGERTAVAAKLIQTADQILVGVASQVLAVINIDEIEQRSPDLSEQVRKGTEVYTQAVGRLLAKTLEALPPDDQKKLAQNPRRDLLVPLYGASMKTSQDITRSGVAAPYEMRLAFAGFAQILWDEIKAHDIDFEVTNPQALAVELGVPDDPRLNQGRAPVATSPVQDPGVPADIAELIADLSSSAARTAGVIGPPTHAVMEILAIADALASAALLSNQDMFRTLLGPLANLPKTQRKALGFTLINKYPRTSVSYVKALLIEAGKRGMFDFDMAHTLSNIEDGYS